MWHRFSPFPQPNSWTFLSVFGREKFTQAAADADFFEL